MLNCFWKIIYSPNICISNIKIHKVKQGHCFHKSDPYLYYAFFFFWEIWLYYIISNSPGIKSSSKERYLYFCLEFVSCGIQSFSVPPTDKEVVEGHDVTLLCQVAHQKGAVQWSKDGVLLGEMLYFEILAFFGMMFKNVIVYVTGKVWNRIFLRMPGHCKQCWIWYTIQCMIWYFIQSLIRYSI